MSVLIQPEDGGSCTYIVEGAMMQCSFGSKPCPIKAKYKGILMRGKMSCSTIDNDPIENAFDFGMCTATQKPCKGCIKLGEWQNYKANFHINKFPALTDKSTIKCTMGGDIVFQTAGQDQVITGVKKYGDEATDPTARLQLTKVAFHTLYDVCSDEVEGFSDEKKFYILHSKGKYYHWLFLRENPEDFSDEKPELIPITWASDKPLKLTATFKVTSEETIRNAPQIRLKQPIDHKEKYLFLIQTAFPVRGKKKDEEFELTFTSTNTPYNDTIRYIKELVLEFECSWDGGATWKSIGSCQNTLYITWREPLWERFRGLANEQASMRVEYKKNINKKNILETLLYLGCSQANGLSRGEKRQDVFEEEVVFKIFEVFKTLKVKRAREGTKYRSKLTNDCMGYWRGISVADSGNPITDKADPRSGMFYDKSKNLHILRCVRSLLKYGEARCGEWTEFFLHILLAQGIEVDLEKDTCAICTDFAIVERGYDYIYRLQPHNMKIKTIIFSVKNAVLNKNGKTSGQSPAQGNDDAQPTFMDHIWVYFKDKIFLDPSYGKIYYKENSNLKEYCTDNLSSMLIENRNYNELTDFQDFNGFIVYENIERYIVCSKEKPIK